MRQRLGKLAGGLRESRLARAGARSWRWHLVRPPSIWRWFGGRVMCLAWLNLSPKWTRWAQDGTRHVAPLAAECACVSLLLSSSSSRTEATCNKLIKPHLHVWRGDNEERERSLKREVQRERSMQRGVSSLESGEWREQPTLPVPPTLHCNGLSSKTCHMRRLFRRVPVPVTVFPLPSSIFLLLLLLLALVRRSITCCELR